MSKVDGGYLGAKMLKAEGVECVFTLSTTKLAPYYEGCEAQGIKIIGMRTEQAAAMAADGWSRVTGKPGVAMFDTGPGFGNAYTGILNAYLAPSPVVYICGGKDNYATSGRGGLMEIDKDYIELARPVTKWSRTCHDTKRIPEYFGAAFRNATAGRPGPVYLEAPRGVVYGEVEESEVSFPANYRTEAMAFGDPSYVRRAAQLLLESERPVVAAGGGVHWSRACDELQKLIEAVEAPVFLNGLGRGAVPPTHAMYFSSHARRTAFEEADVILLVGVPLDFRMNYGNTPWCRANAKVIQVDIDPTEIGRNRGADVGIVGHPKAVLSQFVDEIGGRKRSESGWLAHLRDVERRGATGIEEGMKSDQVPIHPLRVMREISSILEPDDIVVGDGGFFVNIASHVLKVYKPGHWLDNGPMGCLGVGPGFAIAAKLAHPKKRVVLISGDGAFGFNGMDIETMAGHGINVVTIVGNDRSWGMEKHNPLWKDKPIAVELPHGTRYDIIAQGLGCHGERVERPEQIRAALERAFDAGRPALVDVLLSSDSSVYEATKSEQFRRREKELLAHARGPGRE